MNAPLNITDDNVLKLVPPPDPALCNVELEQEVLGSILMGRAEFDLIERMLSAGDFYEPLHAQLWETIAGVHALHGVVKHPLIVASMGAEAHATILDGMTVSQYLAKLAAEACVPRDAAVYAKQIREFSNRRKILATAETMLLGAQSGQSASDIAGSGIELLDEIASQASAGSTPQVSLRDANDEALARMQHAMQNPGKLAGISWGLKGLDLKTGGLKRGEMTVLAGRPGMGKTALASCIARTAAEAGEPTFFASLEMGAVSLADRMLADAAFEMRSRIPYYNIPNGKVTIAQAERLIEAARLQRELPLTIDPAPGLTVTQIVARARRHKQHLERQGKRLGPVIVDHMHIVKASSRYSGQRVHEVSEISAALKGLAKELDVPVIALAQLSRQVENRSDKRPMIADLRDSGSIEQDADAILFVYREAYYQEDLDLQFEARDKLEVIIGKQRNGPTGTVKLFCDITCNAVRDLEDGL